MMSVRTLLSSAVTTDDLERNRVQGRRIVTLFTCFCGLIAILAALFRDNNMPLTATIALCICALSFAAEKIFSHVKDYALVVALLAQTSLITAAFDGHPWQTDSHMIYYVSLAVLILLVNPATLVFGAAMITLHHGLLSLTIPTLVYPASEVLPAVSGLRFTAQLF